MPEAADAAAVAVGGEEAAAGAAVVVAEALVPEEGGPARAAAVREAAPRVHPGEAAAATGAFRARQAEVEAEEIEASHVRKAEGMPGALDHRVESIAEAREQTALELAETEVRWLAALLSCLPRIEAVA